jgi:hypothetical protein
MHAHRAAIRRADAARWAVVHDHAPRRPMTAHRALPAAALMLLTACASGGTPPRSDPAVTPSASGTAAPPGSMRLAATLAATGGSLRGTVTLTPAARANQTRAAVTVASGPADTELGWQIRQGPCGERGTELGPASAYPAIQTRGDGAGEVSVTLPVPLPSGGAYHVDILASRTGDAVLACGALNAAG